jgi:hypothetical protein
MEPVILEGINFADLESQDPRVRRKVNLIVARNESKLYGRLTLATESILRSLDAELGCETNADNSDN